MNQQQEQALNYLGSVVNDFIRSLPASAQGATAQLAQQAISTIKEALDAQDIPPAITK